MPTFAEARKTVSELVRRRIVQLVDKFYGLTEKEIRIVEEATNM